MMSGPEPRLSDRDREMKQLTRTLQMVSGGQHGVCLVTGEAGIGKSLLVREFVTYAQAKGAAVIAGRALEFDRRSAFSTLNDMLASVYRHELAAEPQRHLDALLAATHNWGSIPADATGPAAGEPITALLTRFLRSITTDRTCVVVVDDAHCADDESLQKLCLAFRHLATRPIMLVCTARNDKWIAGSDFAATIGRLVEDRSGDVIELPRLGVSGTRELVHTALSARPDDALVAHVLQQSLGNPLFAEVTVEALSAADLLVVDVGDVYLRAVPPASTVTRRSGLLQRIFQQDEHGRELGRFLSIFGPVRLEQLTIVAELSDLPGEVLQRAFDGLCEAGILTRGPDRAYRFAHPLMAEVLYEDVGPIERRRIHRAIADRLAGESRRFSDVQWALHVVEGADAGDAHAVDVALRVAASLSDPAPLAAAGWYERAIELCEPGSPEVSGFRSAQAIALWKGSRPQSAIKNGLVALESLPPGRDRIRTLSMVVNALYTTNRHAEALKLLNDQAASDAAPSVPLLAQRALLLTQVGDPDEASRQFDAVVELIGESTPENEAVTYSHLAHAASTGRCWTEAKPWVDHLVAIGTRAAGSGTLDGARLAALESAAYIYCEVGFLREGRCVLAQIASRAPAGARDIGGQGAYAQAVSHYFAGEWHKALECLRTDAVTLDFAGLENNLGWLRSIEVDILTEQGKYDEAERILTQHHDHLDGGQAACGIEIMRARLRIGRGHVADGLATLNGLAELSRVRGWRRLEARALESLARGYLEAGEGKRAAVFAEQLKRIAAISEIPKIRWSSCLTTALIRKSSTQAEELLDYAQSEGLGFIAAQAQYVVAVLRDDDTDLLKRAMVQFDQMDARPWRQRVLARLQRGVAGATASDPANELSETEQQLISMVRQGLNNREIATALHYSRKTVEAYLSRLYRKFGCRSRVGLVVALEGAEARAPDGTELPTVR